MVTWRNIQVNFNVHTRNNNWDYSTIMSSCKKDIALGMYRYVKRIVGLNYETCSSGKWTHCVINAANLVLS